jgi:2-polyprenyl-3-methyl-5-hydroxy-6-metoxy-1,4-benzoquinol methylase
MKNSINENQSKFGEIQVCREHYLSEGYLGVERFISLHSQFRLCMAEDKDSTFLEIGPGPGLLVGLMNQFGRKITTVDFAEDLNPDHVAALPNLPFNDDAFDVVCAFEVLEHIPWDIVPACIDELRRLARRKVLISIPNQSRIFEKSFSISMTFGKKKMSKNIWRKRLNKITNSNEHFWEIGHNGVTVKDVIDVVKRSGFICVDTFYTKPWFQFFVLEKQGLA